MKKNIQKEIDELNTLVEINNDRIEGYESAAKETDDATLKSLFLGMADASRTCKQELTAEIEKLGGTPKEGTATSGKLYRVWMDVKAAVTNKDRKAILNSCEYGEDVAVKAYEDALDKCDDVLVDHRKLIEKQYSVILAGHDKMRELRNETVKV
jgi:uncharacterized protein (TIGR02284 family)